MKPNRIIVGVTGHRVLKNEDDLKKKINQALKIDVPKLLESRLNNNYNSLILKSIVYTIITPLAEGADRLVATAMLEYDERTLLEVILPLTLSDYKKTFKDPYNLYFKDLLGKANKIEYLRTTNIDDNLSNDKNERGTENNKELLLKKSFETAGRYVVDKCDVLMVLWNGKKSLERGGTYSILQYAKSIKRPTIIISTNPPYNVKVVNGIEEKL